MELPESVENRLKLLKAFGFSVGSRQDVEIQLAQLGKKRWFESKNLLIEQARENFLKSGTPWQRSRLTGDLNV